MTYQGAKKIALACISDYFSSDFILTSLKEKDNYWYFSTHNLDFILSSDLAELVLDIPLFQINKQNGDIESFCGIEVFKLFPEDSEEKLEWKDQKKEIKKLDKIARRENRRWKFHQLFSRVWINGEIITYHHFFKKRQSGDKREIEEITLLESVDKIGAKDYYLTLSFKNRASIRIPMRAKNFILFWAALSENLDIQKRLMFPLEGEDKEVILYQNTP